MSDRARILLVAPDKFRGSLTAPEVVEAVAAGAEPLGWQVIRRPMADGGEGMLDAFGGANRVSVVTGPAGRPVRAAWRFGADRVAVVECATASGLAIAGGASSNDPMTATSRGSGELIAEAIQAGAKRVIVGLGGSAMSDGGLAAVEAVLEGLHGQKPFGRGAEILVACDVQTVFTDAAKVFGPQKGASPEQVLELTERLERMQKHYLDNYGVHLDTLPGGGAAGGLGGALVVLGGKLVPGLKLVAEQVGLDAALAQADAVVTGEGALDAESFNGKVIGGVLDLAQVHGIPVIAIAGVIRDDAPADRLAQLRAVSLSETYGSEASWHDTANSITRAVTEQLSALDRA